MIHIIGASGLIGRKLSDYLVLKKELHKNYSRSVFDHVYFDLENVDAFDFSKFNKDDIVFFLAAVSSPDKCSEEYSYSYKVNVMNTKRTLNNILNNECKVVFFSSDTVYGDNNEINDEDSNVNPNSEYSSMKYEIENTFKNNKNFFVVRLSYVFSNEDKFYSYLHNVKKDNSTAVVYNGLIRNVVDIDTVVKALYAIYKNFDVLDFRLVNVIGKESQSRVDLLYKFIEKFGKINYEIINTPKEILKNRPNAIFTKSKHLSYLLKQGGFKYE